MTHPTEDSLLLFAYGELPVAQGDVVTAHLTSCAACRAALERLEHARIAVEWAVHRRRRRTARWIAAGLAAAAVLVVVLARGRPAARPLAFPVPRYAIGELAPLDSLLTRLEQEKPYAIR